MSRLKTVLNRVAQLLEQYPHLRNDDRDLIFAYWRMYDGYGPKPPRTPVTSPETIRRARQKLQEKSRYQPTDPVVLKRRKRREDQFRDWFGR